MWPALLLLILACAALAWWVLRPLPVHRHQHLAGVVTTQPTSPAATTRPTPLVSATASTSPSPTPLPSPVRSGGARLAIIIDDCGQWLRTERGFIALPIPVTLSVLPDVRYTGLIAREAQDAGQGVMLHLPMQPISAINPGPGAITTTMSDAAIRVQVEADLEHVPLAQGVNNHEGSKATANPRVMRDVAQAIARHGGLFFVDSLTIANSVAAKSTREAGIPSATRDVFLDDRANVAYTQRQLLSAAAVARQQGSAIAIGHPRPTTLAALRAMIPKLESEGVRFVLVRDIVSGVVPASTSPQ